MEHVLATVGRLVEKDKGQDLLEYALLLGLIAMVAIAAVAAVGQTVSQVLWGFIAAAL